jgi:hypothetical protein
MTSNYNQLILVDCDGGRASIFNDKTILYQLPSNCECYLFWNKDNETVTHKLNQLHDNPQIHLCPSHLRNSKNSADGKLIYFLGKLVENFHFILILHGNDNIYNEVIQSVVHDYGQQKIDHMKIQRPIVKDLKDVFVELQRRNKQHNYIDPSASRTPSQYRSIHQLTDMSEKTCLKCSKRFQDISSLCNHVKAKHKQNIVFSCACSFKCTTLKEFNSHRKETQRQIIDKQGVVRCLFTQLPTRVYLTPHSAPMTILTSKTNQCSFNCPHRCFEPLGLFNHLTAKHGKDIDIRVQCCDLNVKYTLDEFSRHIYWQHDIVDIQ